jgi:two-component system osmolarity sensor histidine kinase EnvZ
MADLAHAFNQMSHDLQELDADRALILAGVSHDLRTPLARLRLGIEMCGADPADVDAMVSDIEDMDRIIGQFLAFSKEDGDEGLETMDLGRTGQRAGRALRPPGISHLTVLATTAARAVRPQALRRAVTNLIENALHYAGHPPEISPSACWTASPMIEVLDRGPGIPAIPDRESQTPLHPSGIRPQQHQGLGARSCHRRSHRARPAR